MGPGGRRRETSDGTLCGVYYGIVCQNKDDELKLGRIKVRLPWLPGGDQDQAHWAQLAVPMAGDKFGTFTLPEVDDTVLVAFIGGDIRQPVVLGGIWNKTDKPPEVNDDGKNDYRFIKSRAGHRLLMDDSSNTKVALTDKDNAQLIGVGKLGKGSGPNALEVKMPQGGGTSGVGIGSAQGTVNIWCPKGTLTIKASTDAKITAMTTAEVKAKGDMKIEGGLGSVSGTAPVKLDGGKVKIN